MDLEQTFNQRIAVLHNTNDPTKDLRHEEFQALAEVFLGPAYDPVKLRQVEGIQVALHAQQASLYQLYQTRQLDAKQYVEAFNTLLADTFARCEAVLGQQDFLRFFGAPRHELGGFIELAAFLDAHQN